MKKLLLIAAALTTMVSCSKTQVIPEQTAQQEISMKAYNQAAVKADPDPTEAFGPIAGGALNATNAYQETMSVFGFYTNENSEADTDLYLNNVTYKWNTTNSKWQGYAGSDFKAYYWPSVGTMDFAIVFPTAYSSSTSEGITYLNNVITINDVALSTITSQKDIMYAISKNKSCATAGNVELTMNHLLSQVVVNVTPSVDNSIVVDDITLLNVCTSGDITINASTEEVNYVRPKDNEEKEVTGSIASLTSGKGALVIPTGTVEPKLKITYHLSDNANVSISHTIDLFDGNGTVGNTEGWNAGYKYIYNVTIGIEEITFTATVNAWTDNTVTPAPSI